MIKKCYKRSKFNPCIKVLSLLYLQEQKLLHYILGHISILLSFNYFIFQMTGVRANNVFNDFIMLANTQFVENVSIP